MFELYRAWAGSTEGQESTKHRIRQYEKEFHMKYLDKADTSISLAEAYKQWKAEFVQEYLPGKSNPYGDDTNWLQVFENGSNLQKDLTY